jgi:hypothetical protein
MAAGKLPQLDRPAVDGTELGQAQLNPSAVLNHSFSSPHEQQFHVCYSLVCCGMMYPPRCELALSVGFFI